MNLLVPYTQVGWEPDSFQSLKTMPPYSRDEQAVDLINIFDGYRAFKTSNWNPHYRKCDKYYAGFYDPRTWPGTDRGRSDMMLHVTSDLIETVYSSIVHTVFFSGGENFFDIVSDETKVARQLTERLRFILHSPISAAGNTSVWALFRAIRYLLKYGIGICSVNYDYNIQRPTLTEVSPYDLYWSPSAGGWIDQSPYLFQFTRVPLEQLLEYRPLTGFKLPTRKILEEYSNYTIDPSWEDKKEAAHSLVGQDVKQRGTEQGSKEIDVIRVTDKEYVRWVIPSVPEKGPLLAFEGPNRMKEQPYVAAVYRPLLNGIGGVSPVALLAPEHHLQQRVVNTGLDLLELHATPPMSKEAGISKEPIWGPGVGNDVITEKGGQPLQLPRIPPELFGTYAESRARSMRIIGTNEMAISGQPKASNANRTASGIELQSAAREERQFGPALEVESTLVLPALLKCILSDRVAVQSGQLEGMSTQRASTEIDPKILEARMHLELRGATRMVNLQRLNNVFRLVVEYVTSPQMQEMAAKHGQEPDFNVLSQFISDATSTNRKYKFYKPMSQEQQDAFQERQLAEQRAKAQAQMEVEELRAGNKIDVSQLQARNKELVETLKQEGLSDDRANQIIKLIMTPKPPAPSEGAKAKPASKA